MTGELIIDGAQIVVVGDLNPSILHPSWFAKHDLLTEEELEVALVSVEEYNQIGDVLTPKEHWVGIVQEPKLRVLRMEGRNPNVKSDHRLWVMVEPSELRPNTVLVSTNEHYEMGDSTGADVEQLVTSRWRDSVSDASKIAESVTDLGLKV